VSSSHLGKHFAHTFIEFRPSNQKLRLFFLMSHFVADKVSRGRIYIWKLNFFEGNSCRNISKNILTNALWREKSTGATFIDQTRRIQKLSRKTCFSHNQIQKFYQLQVLGGREKSFPRTEKWCSGLDNFWLRWVTTLKVVAIDFSRQSAFVSILFEIFRQEFPSKKFNFQM